MVQTECKNYDLETLRAQEAKYKKGQSSAITQMPKGYFDKRQLTLSEALQLRSKQKRVFEPLTTYENARSVFWKVIQAKMKSKGSSFEVDDSNRQTLADLCAYFSRNPGNLDRTKGIILMGSVGTGKTLLMEICRTFCGFLRNDTHGFRIDSCKDIYNEVSFRHDVASLEKYMKQNRCFDDLGHEPTNFKLFGNDVSVFEIILSARYDREQKTEMITHATTNLNLDEIGERYGGRIKDRIVERFNIVVLDGESRRK